jgi:fumarylacetoacetate (FAA) hydrolase
MAAIGAAVLRAMRLVTFRDPGGATRVGRVEDDRIAVLEAPTMLAWLAGEGRDEAGKEHALAEVELLAPVPEPPSVRDFYAYEEHVATGARLRGGEIPPEWYEVPVFYFSNPASIHGPGEQVRKPELSSLLDFELEIAAVIGPGGEIAGFTLFNDWSARDLQRQEMAVGLGPAKGKDFAISLGPWIATPDELPYRDGRLHLEATAEINGEEVTRTDAGAKQWSWPELVAHAARDTRLRPGDVIGSGTLNRGCLLELGPIDGERFLEPGDTVALAAEGLGRLEARVV